MKSPDEIGQAVAHELLTGIHDCKDGHHGEVCRKTSAAVSAAIKARDAEHAARVRESAEKLYAWMLTYDVCSERRKDLSLRAGERFRCAEEIEAMAAAPAVVPAETPGSCSTPHPFTENDEDDLCGRWRATRTKTRQFDPTTPNGRLMVAVCAELSTPPTPSAPPAPTRTPIDWDGTGNCAMCRSGEDCSADFHNDDCPKFPAPSNVVLPPYEDAAPSAPPREGMGPVVTGHTTMCPANAAGPCICKRGGRR